MRAFLVVPFLFAGCVHMQVPSNVAGDTPLRVENGLQYVVCGLDVSFEGGPAVDWMDGHAFNDGYGKTLSVKKGAYQATVTECPGFRDHFKGRVSFRVDGPTRLRLVPAEGPADRSAPAAGYTDVRLSVVHAQEARQCEEAGYQIQLGTEYAEDVCCSKRSYNDPQTGAPTCS